MWRSTEEDARRRRRQDSSDAAGLAVALGEAWDPIARDCLPGLAPLMQGKIERAGRSAGVVMGSIEIYRAWASDPSSLRDCDGQLVEIDPALHARAVARIRATDRLDSPTACEVRD